MVEYLLLHYIQRLEICLRKLGQVTPQRWSVELLFVVVTFMCSAAINCIITTDFTAEKYVNTVVDSIITLDLKQVKLSHIYCIHSTF